MSKLIAVQANRSLASDNQKPIIELTKFGKLLCYEKCSGRWFRSSEEHVRDAINQLQNLYECNICVNLNNFYELLGIYTTNKGSIYGWNLAVYTSSITLFNIELIDKGFMTMDEPVLVIEPIIFPEKDYRRAF